jgi:hypothetical protein
MHYSADKLADLQAGRVSHMLLWSSQHSKLQVSQA